MMYQANRKRIWMITLKREHGGVAYHAEPKNPCAFRPNGPLTGWSAGSSKMEAVEEAIQHIDLFDGKPEIFAQTPKRIS